MSTRCTMKSLLLRMVAKLPRCCCWDIYLGSIARALWIKRDDTQQGLDVVYFPLFSAGPSTAYYRAHELQRFHPSFVPMNLDLWIFLISAICTKNESHGGKS